MLVADLILTFPRPVFILISLFALSLGWLLYTLSRPWFFSSLKDVPGPSFNDGHFVWGHYPAILRSQAGIIQRDWVHTFGSVVRAVGPFGFERLIFSSIPALKTILIDQHHHFDKPLWVAQILGITTGTRGILAASGGAHKYLRQWFSPMFSKRNTLDGRAAISRHASIACDTLEHKLEHSPNNTVHIYPLVSRLALDIAASTIIGVEPLQLGTDWDQVASAYHRVLSYQSGVNITKFIALLKIPGVDKFLQSNLCYRIVQYTGGFVGKWLPALDPVYVTVNSMHTIRTVARRIVETRLKQNMDMPVDGSQRMNCDFLNLVIDADNGLPTDNTKLERPLQASDAMVDQVLAFVGAGHETIAGAVSWTLWLLASHPNAQDRLREEICSYGLSEDLSDSTLHRLPYLTAVIHESLRMFPPIPTSFREALVDTWVDGTFVPKGTMIYVGIRTMNMLEGYWGQDAAEFHPDRWLWHSQDVNETTFDMAKPIGAENSAAFQSFLFGSHACMGREMAMNELRIIIASFIRKFSLSPSYAGQQAQPTVGVTMTPADELPLCLQLI